MKLGFFITVLAKALTHSKFNQRDTNDVPQVQITPQAPQADKIVQVQAPQVPQPQATQNITQAAELLIQQLNQKNNDLQTQEKAAAQQANPNISQDQLQEAINSILQKSQDTDVITKEQMEQIIKYNITAKEVKQFMKWLQSKRFRRLHRKVIRHHRMRREDSNIQQILNISAHEVKQFIQWLQTKKARKTRNARLSRNYRKSLDLLQNTKKNHRKLSHARKSRKTHKRN